MLFFQIVMMNDKTIILNQNPIHITYLMCIDGIGSGFFELCNENGVTVFEWRVMLFEW